MNTHTWRITMERAIAARNAGDDINAEILTEISAVQAMLSPNDAAYAAFGLKLRSDTLRKDELYWEAEVLIRHSIRLFKQLPNESAGLANALVSLAAVLDEGRTKRFFEIAQCLNMACEIKKGLGKTISEKLEKKKGEFLVLSTIGRIPDFQSSLAISEAWRLQTPELRANKLFEFISSKPEAHHEQTFEAYEELIKISSVSSLDDTKKSAFLKSAIPTLVEFSSPQTYKKAIYTYLQYEPQSPVRLCLGWLNYPII